MRVGMGQGLQWFGRERLAQAWYRAAEGSMRSGHTTRALLDANLALSLQPTFLDAIRLREQVLQKDLAEPAGAAIKDLVRRRILPSEAADGDDVHLRDAEGAENSGPISSSNDNGKSMAANNAAMASGNSGNGRGSEGATTGKDTAQAEAWTPNEGNDKSTPATGAGAAPSTKTPAGKLPVALGAAPETKTLAGKVPVALGKQEDGQ
jgi:hypothetical protein